jgi:hypothetical protein
MLASTAAPNILRVLLFPIFLWPMAFSVDIENEMRAANVPFTVVVDETMEDTFHARFTSEDGGMIYFYTPDGTFSYGEFLGGAVHEMIHYYRWETGLWSGNQRFEEAVACYGADILDTEMKMSNIGSSPKQLDAWFLLTLDKNNLDMVPLTDDERAMVEIAIEDTLMAIKSYQTIKQLENQQLEYMKQQ